MFDFSSIKAAVQNMASTKRDISSQIEKARREREEVIAAPPTKPEVVRLLTAYMEVGAAEFEKTFTSDLFNVLRKRDHFPLLTAEPDGGLGTSHHAIRLFTSVGTGSAPSVASMAGGMYFLMGDVLKQSIVRVVNEMDWPKGALDGEARSRRLAELDSKIADLESKQTQLLNEARQAGISF